MQLALAARQSLLTKIRENFEVIVPNYTNGVAAQPNALAHQWLGHVQSFERDFRALAFAWQELNFSPMGSCVLNGTGWPLNRKRMAQLLGFDGVLLNAYDAGQIATEDAFLSVSQVLGSFPARHHDAVRPITTMDFGVQYVCFQCHAAKTQSWIVD